MGKYIRIIYGSGFHSNEWKEPCMRYKLSTIEHHIEVVKNFTKDNLEMKTEYLKREDKHESI